MLDYLRSLNDDQIFELVKIAFDKLIIALIVAVAGFWLKRALEKSKSKLKKQEDLANFVRPAVNSISDDSRNLLETGLRTVSNLNNILADFDKWANNIYASSYHASDEFMMPSELSEDIADRIEMVDDTGKRISFSNFILGTYPDSILRHRVENAGALTNVDLYKGTGPMKFIIDIMRAPLNERSEAHLFAIKQAIMTDIFIMATKDERKIYTKSVIRFLMQAMQKIPTNNRIQRKSMTVIAQVVNDARDTIEKYPKGYIFSIKGQENPPTIQGLLNSVHGAIISHVDKISHNL